MNPTAEALTGTPEPEGRGRPLDEVFRIIDAETRHPISDLVGRVARAGTADHTDDTLLLARDGSERAIEQNTAPIQGDGGELLGVILSFRDATERRRAEDRRAFLGAATNLLVSSLDYETTLDTVAWLAVPRLADWCSISIL